MHSSSRRVILLPLLLTTSMPSHISRRPELKDMLGVCPPVVQLTGAYCGVAAMAWLSICSKLQIIGIWSSWFHCHPMISCFIEIQNGSAFLVLAYTSCPGKETIKQLCVDNAHLLRLTFNFFVFTPLIINYWFFLHFLS